MSDHVIDDSTPINVVQTLGPCGALPRREPFGALPFAQIQPVDVIPWEEWPDRIADDERNKSSLWHIWQDSKMGVLDQNPLLYCWAFCSVGALILEREIMGLPYLPLSPSSVAAPVVGYSNQGYYVANALEWMSTKGVATTDYVPQTTCSRADFRQGWVESASCNRVTMWQDVGNDPQIQGSMLFAKKPLPVQHNWWSHAILHLQVLDRNPRLPANNPMRYGRRYLNSWGKSFGTNGCGILEGQRAIADAAYAVAQANFAG